MPDHPPSILCNALAGEIREVRAMIEALADVLAADEYLAANYLEQLQMFDLLVQRTTESADLLDRLGSGMHQHDAIAHIRLERMQHRLRDMLKAA
jgi:hypothetical protein